MAKLFNGKVLFASAMQPTGAQPLDDRVVVQSYSDLTDVTTFGDAKYLGMVVSVVDTAKLYTLTNSDVTAEGAWKEIGAASESDVNSLLEIVGNESSGLVKDVNDLKATIAEIPDTYATKEDLSTAIGNVDFSKLATKEEVSTGLAAKVDASVVYTKDEADGKYVAKDGYVAYTQEDKDKLVGLANIMSVGDNLSIVEGELQVSIPEVEVPFQSVAEGDKLLTLSEGVLKSDVSFGLVDGKIQLTGKNNEVIGEVDTTDFVVDGVLDTVAWSEEEGKENILVLTWNTDSGKTAIEIDFGKYVDAYGAGEGITLTDKTFAVDYSKVERAGAAATAEQNAKDYADSLAVNYDASGAAASVEAKLDAYKESNDAALESGLAAKVDADAYNNKMTEIDGSISSIKTDLSNVYTKDEVDGLVSPLAVKTDVSAALELKANVSDVNATVESLNSAIDSKVNNETYESKIGEIETTIGTLAVKADVSAALELKANVSDVYTKDEVDGLVSPLATSEELTNGLATKLDVSAKVNGVSFVNGELTINAGDVSLGAKIEPTVENGATFTEDKTILEVLTSISRRIDSLDPTVDGEYGVAEISAGNGIEISGSTTNPQVSVKVSEVSGNMVTVDTNGVYVADMRSYWEAI